jgi:hypothetical protein
MLAGTATVDLSVFQRLREQTRQAAVGLCQKAAHVGALAGRDRARELAPIGTYYTASGARPGGRLKKEITVHFDRALPFGSQWEIVADTPYARYVEEGTSAHVIVPMKGFGERGQLLPGQSRRKSSDYGVGRGQWLRWYGPSGGVHWAREVHHPGTQAQPFMGPGGIVARETMIFFIESGFVGIATRWN